MGGISGGQQERRGGGGGGRRIAGGDKGRQESGHILPLRLVVDVIQVGGVVFVSAIWNRSSRCRRRHHHRGICCHHLPSLLRENYYSFCCWV